MLDRGGEPVTLSAVPDLKEIEDRFGNTHKVGLLGISSRADPEDVTLVTYSVPGAVWRGVQETWFVIERTISFIVGIVAGKDDASQLGGPIRIAQISGDVAQVGLGPLVSLDGDPVGQHRAAEPVSDSHARRRTPAFLRRRSGSRASAEPAHGRHQLPDRAGAGADVDAICHLERSDET